MDISPTVRDRINSAADALYEAAGRRIFPTVDAVRKHAKVNMNDANTCMRAWRRAQATHMGTLVVQVPDALQQASTAALHALWKEAVSLSNETLRAAQAGWDAERTDMEALNEQMANAFETQSAELTAVQAEVASLKQEVGRLADTLAATQRLADKAKTEAAASLASAEKAAATAIEAGRRADDMRQALDRAHATHAASSAERAESSRAYIDEIAGLRSELAEARRRFEAIEVAARIDLHRAREEAANLRGKLEAIAEAQAIHADGPRARRKGDDKVVQ